MAIVLGRKGGGAGGGGGAPSGPAGGDLSGTYPNPALSVAKQAEVDGKVPKSLYDANTVLAANSDDTPAAVTMGASTVLARLAAGNIKAASVAEMQTLLGITSPAMVQLYDNVAAGAIASWDVSGISQAYNHLKIVLTLRGDTVATVVSARIRFNNDSGNNYDSQRTYSNNAGVAGSGNFATSSLVLLDSPAASSAANAAGTMEVLIPSYAATTFNKGLTMLGFAVQQTYGTNDYAWGGGGDWKSTAAITRVTVFPAAGNWIAGSRLTIYGLL